MALLAGVAYDPASAVSKVSSSLLAMTALDTTNLRVTFTAPANGTVLVRLRGCMHGSAADPVLLLGVMDGSTVKGRQSPIGGKVSSSGTMRRVRESVFLVTGLTPSTSYTWDAAYAVQVVAASSAIKYGGPNDTTGDNAFGAFSFEVWETTNLLAGVNYDPAAAVSKSTASLIAMTAFDTTNLRLTFTAPASGKVLVRMRTLWTGATGTNPSVILGVLDGSTVKARFVAGAHQQQGTNAASDVAILDGCCLVTGLTPTQSYTWDAAYSVEVVLAATNIKYGGPNDTTGNDAWGGFAYEIWAA